MTFAARAWRSAGFTKRLIYINCGVYLFQAMLSGITTAFALYPPAVVQLQVWRLFTYMFLHGGLFHLAMNMVALHMFGTRLEETWGRGGFLRYYLLCGVGAGLFTLVPIGGFFYANHVGASGAVYGVLLAYGLLFPNTRLSLFGAIPIKALHLVLVLGFIALASSVSATQDGVSHIAHLGGLGAGYFLLRHQGRIPPGLLDHHLSRLRNGFDQWRMRQRRRRMERERQSRPQDPRGPDRRHYR